MKKSSIFSLLYILFFTTTILSAQTYRDGGFYGDLSFLYWEEEVDRSYKYTLSELSQELKLGYKGNIYSPKLLDYTLEGLIRFAETENKNEFSESKIDTSSLDYRVNFDFIKNTRFPFMIYANKNERPMATLNSGATIDYLYKSQSSGISGNINFKPLSIAYGASKSSNTLDASESLEEREIIRYNTSLQYNEESSNFQLKYTRFDEKVKKESLNASEQLSDSVDMYYQWKISKELRFVSSASYRESEYSSTLSKSSNAYLNLNWRPTSKFNASLTANGSRIDSIYTESSTEELSGRFDSYNIAQSLSYNITPTLSISQFASQYIYESETVSGDIININLNIAHSYRKTYSSGTSLMISTSLGGQTIDSTYLQIEDNNSSSTSTQRYTFSSIASITEQFPSISSRISMGVDYYKTLTSTDEIMQRYGSNIYLLSNFSSILLNNLKANILKSDTESLMYDEGSASYLLSKHSMTVTSVSDTLGLTLRLGIDGKFRFKVGVMYINSKVEDEYTERIKPLASISLNYQFTQKLIFDANAHIDRDLIEEYTNYTGSANLRYSIGKTFLEVRYNYYKTEYDPQINLDDYERNKFHVKLTRKF